jgi:predicted O-methyltransferase YrrM
MNYRFNCSNGTGRLLRLFTSLVKDGVVGEIGSGCGVGSAWIVSGLPSSASFVTIEKDPMLSAVVRTLFDNSPMVRVIGGDWDEIEKYAPINLLYISANIGRFVPPDILVQSLQINGMVLIDGLVPLEQLAPKTVQNPDPIRDFWLNDSRIETTEILVSSSEAVLLSLRIH